MRLYALFGITTPETTLSFQSLSPQEQQKFASIAGNPKIPKIFIMSRVLEGFRVLGKNFLSAYKQNGSENSYFFRVEGEKVPLRGYGRVIVVSILVHDYDCVGNSGGNMGYIFRSESKYAEIVKIDPGEALSFAEDMTGVPELANPPTKREARIGTYQSPLQYSQLKPNDQKEFIQAAREILEMPDAKIIDVFQDFLGLDKRFGTILNALLRRKEELLSAFSPEVRTLIVNQINELKTQKAEELMTTWGKSMDPSLLVEEEPKEQIGLILQNARLEAFRFVHAGPEEPKFFQVPQKNRHFVEESRYYHRPKGVLASKAESLDAPLLAVLDLVNQT